MQVQYIVGTVLLIWLVVLTASYWYSLTIVRKLGKGVKTGNLVKILDNLLEKQGKDSVSIRGLEKELEEVKREGENHFNKIGFVRFNPFNEMGGDHSFVLCLLNGHSTGMIITGLHTREKTRVYVKEVVRGKSKLELSKEENKALLIALKK